ncbi:MAG: MATE family efflux transporter [Zoogloeaceae bacterium]|nr:MATE family efflux transporter [Zoogloeaceae bacterium]
MARLAVGLTRYFSGCFLLFFSFFFPRFLRPTSWAALFEGARKVVALAWPILVAQLVSMGMMVCDTLIVGHYSTAHLAAVALGGGLFVTLMLGMAGVLTALIPILGQSCGAGAAREVGAGARDGFWLAVFLSLLGTALTALFPKQLLSFGRLPPEAEEIAVSYLRLLAFSLPASLGYRVFHAVTNAVGFTAPLMYIALLETTLHMLVAFCLVGGVSFLGIPALGASGAAVSQILVNWTGCAASLWLLRAHPRFAPYRVFGGAEETGARLWKPRLSKLLALLRLGLPMGASYLVEVSSFTLMAFFIARLGTAEVSGYRIAANVSAITYMLPLAISTATAALVAQAVGAGKEARARDVMFAGQMTAITVALAMSFTLYFARVSVARLATSDTAVIVAAAAMIVYIAAYQFFDAIQTVAAFTLRAYKISLLPLVVHLGCFWGLGLGLGYGLAFAGIPFLAVSPQGSVGFWQATVIASFAAAIFFGVLLSRVLRRRLHSIVSQSSLQGV